MPDLLEPLQYAFIIRALVGAALVAVVCGTVGVFVVLRGLAFLGDAIAHAAFPGVVIAHLLRIDLVLGGSVAAVLGAISMGALARRTGLREDAAIGIVFSGMFALGIVLFSAIPGYTGDLLGVLLGDVLGVTDRQLLLAAVTAAVVVVALRVLWKELVFVSFDPTGASAAGVRPGLYDVVLMVLVGLAIAVSIQIVGVVLVLAMLVTPAAAARLIATDLPQMVAASLAVALFGAVAGIYVSYFVNTASGGTIVLMTTAIFALVWGGRSVLRRA
jgi:manganese/iron transport system permease protein